MTVAPHAAPGKEGFERGNNMATIDGDLGKTTAGLGASLIGVNDAAGNFTGVTNGVEGCLANLGGIVGKGGTLVKCSVVVAAVTGNHKCDVTVQIKDLQGNNVALATKVFVTSVAVTASKGGIGAPDVVVAAGTIDAVQNPATGDNTAQCTTDATGLLTFSVVDSVAEKVGIQITPDGGITSVVQATGG